MRLLFAGAARVCAAAGSGNSVKVWMFALVLTAAHARCATWVVHGEPAAGQIHAVSSSWFPPFAVVMRRFAAQDPDAMLPSVDPVGYVVENQYWLLLLSVAVVDELPAIASIAFPFAAAVLCR